MVDPSLLRQAADRGVTICFADLDGADGLWVPEERTVLVNRGLSDAAVAEVIEHELAHVAIDDQHADLDAGREVIVGRPPSRRTGPVSMVLAAAALVAVVGGVAYGLSQADDGPGEQLVGPAPDMLTASEGGGEAPRPTTTVVVSRDAEGRIVTQTITVTAPAAPARSAGSRAPGPSATPAAPRSSAAPTVRPEPTGSPSAVLTPPVKEPSPTPAATTTTPAPTSASPTPTVVVPDPGDAGAGGEASDPGGTDGLPAGGTDAVLEQQPATAGPVSTGPGSPTTD